MGQPKLSISADDAIVAEVKAAASEDSESVSAWIIDAARAKLRNRALGLAVADALTEHGILPEEALSAYDAARRSAMVTGTRAA
jgi:hypothetical protein